jgi:hypothetical protein
MKFKRSRGIFVRILSVALVTAGFAQTAFAGTIATDYMLESEARDERIARVEAILARDDVAAQMEKMGVDAAMVSERLDNLTDDELMTLEARIDTETAGGSALGVIGAVFLVLLILELVGVTDIFKSI